LEQGVVVFPGTKITSVRAVSASSNQACGRYSRKIKTPSRIDDHTDRIGFDSTIPGIRGILM